MVKFDNSIALLVLILIAFIAYLTRCTCTDRFIVSSGAAGRVATNVKDMAVEGGGAAWRAIKSERENQVQQRAEALIEEAKLEAAAAGVTDTEINEVMNEDDPQASLAAIEDLIDGAQDVTEEREDNPRLWEKIISLENRVVALESASESESV